MTIILLNTYLNKVCNSYIFLTIHPPQWHNVTYEWTLSTNYFLMFFNFVTQAQEYNNYIPNVITPTLKSKVGHAFYAYMMNLFEKFPFSGNKWNDHMLLSSANAIHFSKQIVPLISNIHNNSTMVDFELSSSENISVLYLGFQNPKKLKLLEFEIPLF